MVRAGQKIVDSLGRTWLISDAQPRSGGQGDVYRATGPGGTPVAIKLYRDGTNTGSERRILEAIGKADASADEWLVTLKGSGTWNGRPFLVLPWMQESMTTWLARRDLPARLAALEQAAAAVVRLHRSPQDLASYRVHRDIKPGNLLVSEEGSGLKVRLADLGSAKEGRLLESTSNTGVATPQFAPPEQHLPLKRPPSESWDVHALAATVFYGITRHLPRPCMQAQYLVNHDGLTLQALYDRAVQGVTLSAPERRQLAELSERPPECLLDLEGARGWTPEDQTLLTNVFKDQLPAIPEEVVLRAAAGLGAVLGHALDPDPRRRAMSARPILAALQDVRATVSLVRPAPAQKVVHAPREPTTGRWRWAAVAGLLVIGGAVAAGGVGAWLGRPTGDPAPGPEGSQGEIGEEDRGDTSAEPPPSTSVSPHEETPQAPGPASSGEPHGRATRHPEAAETSSAAPEAGEKTGLRPTTTRATGPTPSRVPVTLAACPLNNVQVFIDGRTHSIPPNGRMIELSAGPQVATWTIKSGTPRMLTTNLEVTPAMGKVCVNLTPPGDSSCPVSGCSVGWRWDDNASGGKVEWSP